MFEDSINPEIIIREWARKKYFPDLHKKVEVFIIPEEVVEARSLIGRKRFFEILSEEEQRLKK